jgi:hypothetical protein
MPEDKAVDKNLEPSSLQVAGKQVKQPREGLALKEF